MSWPAEQLRRRRLLGILAVLVVAGTYAIPVQGPGVNQNTHLALVKAFADGTPVIDRTRYEVGDQSLVDLAYHDGHFYSNKAPGLAFLVTPVYVALHAVGVADGADPTSMLWALGLLGTVLPIALLLLLIRSAGERVAPRYGSVAAVTIGLGTLLFPFGTMLFSHALASLLGFAAFCLLWRDDDGPSRLWPAALAGVLAGFAVVVEYPLALIALILAVYTAVTKPRLRRVGLFVFGGFAGVLPLIVYNVWAFKSVTHISYEGTISTAQQQSPTPLPVGPDTSSDWFWPIQPHLDVAVQLLLSIGGWLVSSPVTLVAFGATILLFRHGFRAEALVVAAISLGLLLAMSGLAGPWGGVPPGPRYLIPMLPFLGLPLALAFRELAAVTSGLAAAWRILASHELGLAVGAAVVAALLLAVSFAVALIGRQREVDRQVQLEATS